MFIVVTDFSLYMLPLGSISHYTDDTQLYIFTSLGNQSFV